MTVATSIPTLPGVTEEQVREAMAIAERVYAELGVPARIEPRLFFDRDTRETTVDIHCVVENQAVGVALRLIREVPNALRTAGLYLPSVPITTYLDTE